MYTEGQPDYRQELGRLSGGAPDAYAVTTYGKDGATINAEMFQLGMTGKPVFDIYMSEDVPDSDPKAVEGRTGMDVSSSTNSDYVAYYRHAYGEEFITTFNGFAYDAVYLAALAIEKAGATGPDALAVAIPAVAAGYTGVTGLLAVGPDGQRLSQSYALGTVKSGKIDFR
jgi:branched-chain amino acid transport system substrate-binding protein